VTMFWRETCKGAKHATRFYNLNCSILSSNIPG
jgi:hypothetical protein